METIENQANPADNRAVILDLLNKVEANCPAELWPKVEPLITELRADQEEMDRLYFNIYHHRNQATSAEDSDILWEERKSLYTEYHTQAKKIEDKLFELMRLAPSKQISRTDMLRHLKNLRRKNEQ